MSSSQSQRPKGPSRLSPPTDGDKNLSLYGDLSEQMAWVSGMCEGAIAMEVLYWHCTETYTAIKKTSFMRSPWLLDQDNANTILHVLQQHGFIDTE